MFLVATIIVLTISSIHGQNPNDPCLTKNHVELDQPERSVGFTGSPPRCDENLNAALWYRFTSKAGWEIPTSCVSGNRCGTVFPIWIDGNTPPNDGREHDRKACVSIADNCCSITYDVKVKRCDGFAVYLLKPTACPMAYCAGTETKCPDGLTSETGFTPCHKGITIPRAPVVTLASRERADFQCNIPETPYPNAIYGVSWYLDDKLVHTEELESLDDNSVFLEDQIFRGGVPWLGKKLYCEVRARFASSSLWGLSSKSDGYYMGIQVSANNGTAILLEEFGPQTEIEIRLTVPFHCDANMFRRSAHARENRRSVNCEMNIQMKNPEEQRPLRCSNGKKIAQVKMGTCHISITPENWDEAHFVPVKATRDFKHDGIRTSHVNFEVSLETGGGRSVWKPFDISPLPVTAGDFIDKNAVCKSINDPHMSTFDGHAYHNFYEGEFVLYRNTKYPMEVHTFYKRCNRRASCNCAVAARVGDDVIVVDRCNKMTDVHIWGTEKVIQYNVLRTSVMSKDDDFTQGFKIFALNDGREYEIHLPTGAYVRAQLTGGSYDQFMNVWVYPSPDDFGFTEGLCGTFDQSRDNDLKMRDGTVYTGSGSKRGGHPNEFSKQWRVSPEESLYNGQVPETAGSYKKNYCTCADGGADIDYVDCQMNSDVERCGYRGTDITDKKLYEYVEKKRNGKLPPPTLFTFDEDFEPENVTWPTPSGWTKDNARTYCEDFLLQSKAAKACENVTSSESIDDEVDNCILDIQLSDGTEWTMTHLESLKKTCRDEAEKSIHTVSPDIEDALCINECSFHGNCKAGSCICAEGWMGSDCSIQVEKAPDAYFIPQGGLCDVRSDKCDNTPIFGDGFVDTGNLACHLQQVKLTEGSYEPLEETNTISAEFENFAEVVCPLYNVRQRRSVGEQNVTVKATDGYLISVSNNGRLLSNPVLFVSYDSRCQTCQRDGSCALKSSTCMIEGFCFKQHDYDPDNRCQRCDPRQTTSSWTPLEGCVEGDGSFPSWAIGVVVAVAVLTVVSLGLVILKKSIVKSSKVTDEHALK